MSYKNQSDLGTNYQLTAILPEEEPEDLLSQLNYLIQSEPGQVSMPYDLTAAEIGRTEAYPCSKKSSWPNSMEIKLTVEKHQT